MVEVVCNSSFLIFNFQTRNFDIFTAQTGIWNKKFVNLLNLFVSFEFKSRMNKNVMK